jgi:predicted CXXCH cytochrome family protein
MKGSIMLGERFGERMDRRIGLTALGVLVAGGILIVSGAAPGGARPAQASTMNATVAALDIRPAAADVAPLHLESVAMDVTPIDNNTCLACHQKEGLTFEFPSGETLSATIDESRWDVSEHGHQGMACVQCHTGITGYPHEPVAGSDVRSFVIDESQVCVECHQEQATAVADSVHAQARAQGDQNAATCSDCHDPHYAVNPPVSRTDVPLTCRKCHLTIYDKYADSVHGSALTTGNPDVPTCTDCHGVHEIQGPDNSPFRLFSPEICASCHADKELMDKYGISTDVFQTYVSDFHGTTVLLFEKFAPDQEPDTPVCIDCHRVHDIIAPDNPRSSVFQENLLFTCQRCHPDAEANFPSAWLGHYEPEPDKWPLVYFVGLFYKILIPTVIGAMLLFVLIDVFGKLRRRRRHD